MRIISGSARGRKLAEFSGSGIRPTPDRVREALFSILTSSLDSFHGLQILELFAGSGALSLEALSRGAESSILVDSSRQSEMLVRDNISRCKMEAKTSFLRQAAETALPMLAGKGPFDLIFMDPPYRCGLLEPALAQIASLQLLNQNGIIAAETAAEEEFSLPETLRLLEARRYGSTTIHLIVNATETGEVL